MQVTHFASLLRWKIYEQCSFSTLHCLWIPEEKCLLEKCDVIRSNIMFFHFLWNKHLLCIWYCPLLSIIVPNYFTLHSFVFFEASVIRVTTLFCPVNTNHWWIRSSVIKIHAIKTLDENIKVSLSLV